MITLSSRVAATAIVSLFLMGSAFAQTQTPAPATPAPAAAPAPKAEKPRSAASLECSKEADTQGIHGKKRHKFMRQCKKDAKAKEGAAKQ
jgi:psiF repeat